MLEGQHHDPGLPAVNEIVRLRKLECYSDYKDSELTLVCSRVRTDTFDAVPRRAGGWQVTRVPPEHIEKRNLGTQDLSKRGQGQTARTQRKRKRSTMASGSPPSYPPAQPLTQPSAPPTQAR